MNITQPFRIFVSLLLVLTHLSAAAETGLPHDRGDDQPHHLLPDNIDEGVDQPSNPFTLPHTFRLILPTVDQSHVAGNTGSLMLNFESTPVDQMDEMIERARSKGLLPDWRTNPPEIFLYLPQDAYDHNRDDLVTEAIKAFQRSYPGVEPKITVRVDSTDVSVEVLYKRLKSNVASERTHSTEAETLAALDQQDEILDLTFQDVKKKLYFTAGQSRRYKKKIAIGRATLLWGIRLGTVGTALFGGLGPATIALTMATADAGVELFTATWSQRMQKALSTNPFALKEQTFFAGKKYEVKSAAINAFMSTAINAMWNMLIFVVIRATILQSFQHAALPALYAWPLGSALLTTIKSNAGPAALNAYFVKGYLSAVNKGWISAAGVDMALQPIAIPDGTNNIANSMPDKIGWVRWYTMKFLMATFITVGFVGGKLPRKTNRIVLIHDAINLDNETNDPRMEQANIAATMNVANDNRDQRFEEAMGNILILRELRKTRQERECEMRLEGDGSVPQNPTEQDKAA